MTNYTDQAASANKINVSLSLVDRYALMAGKQINFS